LKGIRKGKRSNASGPRAQTLEVRRASLFSHFQHAAPPSSLSPFSPSRPSYRRPAYHKPQPHRDADRWGPDDVAPGVSLLPPVTPSLSLSPFALRRRPSISAAPLACQPSAPAGAIRAVHASRVPPCAIRGPPPRHGVASTLAAAGEFTRSTPPLPAGEEGGGGGEEEARRPPPARRRPREAGGPLEGARGRREAKDRDAPASSAPRRRPPFHAGDPASSTPPRFTAACTSARGHQGEAKPPHSSVVDPAFEPRLLALAVPTLPPRRRRW
jgi:hypothetical protein